MNRADEHALHDAASVDAAPTTRCTDDALLGPLAVAWAPHAATPTSTRDDEHDGWGNAQREETT